MISVAVSHCVCVSAMATRVLAVRLGESAAAELQRLWAAADAATVSAHFEKVGVGGFRV